MYLITPRLDKKINIYFQATSEQRFLPDKTSRSLTKHTHSARVWKREESGSHQLAKETGVCVCGYSSRSSGGWGVSHDRHKKGKHAISF